MFILACKFLKNVNNLYSLPDMYRKVKTEEADEANMQFRKTEVKENKVSFTSSFLLDAFTLTIVPCFNMLLS